jgi:hypothetical protein
MGIVAEIVRAPLVAGAGRGGESGTVVGTAPADVELPDPATVVEAPVADASVVDVDDETLCPPDELHAATTSTAAAANPSAVRFFVVTGPPRSPPSVSAPESVPSLTA